MILFINIVNGKGIGHVPKHTHPAIAWSITQPFPLEPITDTAKWELVKKDYKADSQKISKNIDMSVCICASKTIQKRKF